LPFSLIRCGRYRAALWISLDLLSHDSEPSPDLIQIICDAIANLCFSKEELLQVFRYIQDVSLNPIQVSCIASNLQSEDLSIIFLEEATRRYHFSPDVIALINALVCHHQGDDTAALRLLQEAQAQGRLSKDSALLIASILSVSGSLYHARVYACIALKMDRRDIKTLDILGQILYQESRWKATRRVYALIHQIAGDDMSMLNMRFTLPLVALSSKELATSLASYREEFANPQRRNDYMGVEQAIKISYPLCHTFYLAYQGDIGLRDYLESYNSLARSICHQIVSANYTAYSPQGPIKSSKAALVRDDSRIKIGFISKNFYQHSNLQAHEGLISQLDRSRFEVTLIHRQGTTQDVAHNSLNKHADKIIYLGGDFGGNCKLIAKLSLDILYFTDIGMNPLDSLLAMVCLAPKQITGWGIPHTTGLAEIDYYMRSSIFDDCEDAREYTETLAPIDGYIGYFVIDKAALTPKPPEYFMLPPDRFLIGCLQALHKIHPDFDDYLELIARIDESIMIVIAASDHDALNHRFVRRLRTSAPTAYGQICFLQKMGMGDYYSLNQLLDLNLDTVHYGAGITFVQTAWCGPPCVTQRGNTVRSSVVSRSYEYAGITDPPIAKDKAEYVAMVEGLMRNKQRRLELREEIHAKSEGTIYNNHDHINSCQEFFTDLVTRS
jgi:predicted O-linked N-acetylglucosamine transferase (SPINDLY family)